VGLDVAHRVELAVQGVEAQQIYENERHWLVAGARWQGGKFSTHSLMVRPSNYAADFPVPAAASALDEDLERVAAYGYETLKLPASLRLTGGVTYDSLRYPRNFRHPPLAAGGERRERVNPKAAVVWDALPCVTLRGAYLRSLGGVSLDESYRLEPTQLAGFVQDYRTLIPEALVSSVSAPDHEIAGIAADFNLATRTYVTVGAQRLVSEVDRSV